MLNHSFLYSYVLLTYFIQIRYSDSVTTNKRELRTINHVIMEWNGIEWIYTYIITHKCVYINILYCITRDR